MKNKTTKFWIIIVFVFTIAMTAYAHSPGREARLGYIMEGNYVAMMGGHGMMGGGRGMSGDYGSGSGMMHDNGYDDHSGYGRNTTDNDRRHLRDHRYHRGSSDHYRKSPGYDRFNPDRVDNEGRNPDTETNRENRPENGIIDH